jgi:hypothetical protein
VLCRLSYIRVSRKASGRSRTCASTVRRVRAALDTTEALSRVETAGVEPARGSNRGVRSTTSRRRDRHARARHTTPCRQQTNRSKWSWLRRSRSRTSIGSGDGRSRTRIPSVQARCSRPLSYVPRVKRDANEWSRTTKARGSGFTDRGAHRCSAFAREGGRPDSNRHRGDHDPGCCRYTTTTTNADDRIRTGGLSVDSRALCASELHPQAK